MKSYYVCFILLIGLISCSKNTKILESLSNSVFLYSDGQSITFGTFNEKESTFSATCYTLDDVSFDIIYPIRGNPKLHCRREEGKFIFDDIEIIDENTLRNIMEEGEVYILKRQTEEDRKRTAIEKQEEKKQDMKNNIAKYVYIKGNLLQNDSDYTIDEVEFTYKKPYTYSSDRVQEKIFYIKAHSTVNVECCDSKIISVKCKALGLN